MAHGGAIIHRMGLGSWQRGREVIWSKTLTALGVPIYLTIHGRGIGEPGAGRWLDFNPMTGIVELFHLAVLGPFEDWHRAVLVTVVATIVLFAAGIEAHRRLDRLFVDLL